MSSILAKKKLLMAQRGGLDVSDVFNTSLWTGTSAARTITTGIDSGEGSLVWIKGRSVTSSHFLNDTVRLAGNYLQANGFEPSINSTDLLSSFSSSGYILGPDGNVNGSSNTYVGWQFRRAEKFFDIVQYTGNGVAGRQIAHDLGVEPGMIFVKRLNANANWMVYHRSAGMTGISPKYLHLNTADSAYPGDANIFSTAPSEISFSVGTNSSLNSSLNPYIAYLFAHDPSPEGLIQCGSYVGNGSATGPVVNLGWRPQYLMVKPATATGNWSVLDTSRGLSSGVDRMLYPNSSDSEQNGDVMNLTSSGFQVLSDIPFINAAGQTFIYMAIREAS